MLNLLLAFLGKVFFVPLEFVKQKFRGLHKYLPWSHWAGRMIKGREGGFALGAAAYFNNQLRASCGYYLSDKRGWMIVFPQEWSPSLVNTSRVIQPSTNLYKQHDHSIFNCLYAAHRVRTPATSSHHRTHQMRHFSTGLNDPMGSRIPPLVLFNRHHQKPPQGVKAY
ncbi:uncharacterized protein CIMG_13469 [Coccidioides immitis RS]|uniref:Uncharacterized protein n=1 Tax=Coccidioides immitis (strain RS) TaxID=246410 RepID=A0A0D8JV57_COCIM|nr:uncharacterized protein CIMG_13469 [Coccidioides immitis RS]KJF61177.1 hypothetical protein CIMG_13469 [Coccidioides immitis RS]